MSFHTRHLDDENATLKSLLDEKHVPYRDVAERELNEATATARGVTFVATTRPHDAVPEYLTLTLRTSALAQRPTTRP